MITLRDYQERGVTAILGSLPLYNRVLLSHPTGTGKSVCGAEIVNRWQAVVAKQIGLPERVLWLAARDELISQACDHLKAATGIMPAIEKADSSVFKSEETWHKPIVVGSIQTLAKKNRREKFGPTEFGLIILDEAHHSVATQHKEIIEYFAGGKLCGMSVDGSSNVLTMYDGHTEHLTIEELWSRIDEASPDNPFAPLWLVRSFDGQHFGWSYMKGIIRHELGSKRLFRITTERGRSLIVTEDHSLYVVQPDGTIFETQTSKLAVGEYLLLESEVDELSGNTNELIPIIDYIEGSWFKIYGNYTSLITKIWPPQQGKRNVGNTAKLRYQRLRNCKRGPYLTLEEYQKHAPGRKGRIAGAGRGYGCNTHIPAKAFAYFLGFYLGDGWCSKSRIYLAVEDAMVQTIRKKLRALASHIDMKIAQHRGHGACWEVTFGNPALAQALQMMCGSTALSKRIPGFVFQFSESTLRTFLQGLLDSDGHIQETTGNRKQCRYTTISHRLANDLVELLKRLRVVASIKETAPSQGGIVNGRRIQGRHTRYDVMFSYWSLMGQNDGRRGLHKPMWWERDGLPVKIRSIVEIQKNKPQFVYDISVANSEWPAFVANGILVHNTATCDRTDEISLGQIFEHVPEGAHYDILDAMKDGWLAPIKQWFIEDVQLDFSQVRADSHGDLSADDLEEIIGRESGLHAIAKPVIDLVGDRKTLIFTPRVKSAEALAALLCRYTKPGNAYSVSGETPKEERRDLLDDFRQSEFQFLTNADLMGEGIDIPDISCIVMAAPTKSRLRYSQRIGRGLRGGPNCPIPGKDDCLVIDLVGASKHKLCSSANLLGGKFDELVVEAACQQARQPGNDIPTDILAALNSANERADELRREQRQKILAEAKAKRKSVDPFIMLDVPPEKSPGWFDSKLISDDQVDKLKAAGIPTSGLGYSEAQQLLKELKRRTRDGLCTYKQARILRTHGYDIDTTFDEAREIMQELRTNGWKPGKDAWKRKNQRKSTDSIQQLGASTTAAVVLWGKRGGWLGLKCTTPKGDHVVNNRTVARAIWRKLAARGVPLDSGK